MTSPHVDFFGPWNVAEILEDEFKRLDPQFQPSQANAWRIDGGDLLDDEAAAARVAELGLVELWNRPEPSSIVARAIRSVDGFRAKLAGRSGSVQGQPSTKSKPTAANNPAEILNAALELECIVLAKASKAFLRHEAGKALLRFIERAEGSPSDLDVRHRVNRAILECAFEGILRPASDRCFAELFDRAKGTDGAPPRRWALSLSGGGIRSASFCLGVIQALARHGMLEPFDYLSTVSGGGYIGSWLSAWMARSGRSQVQEELGTATAGSQRWVFASEPGPVHHLRSYTRYLAPRGGLLSADAWTLVATVVRNLILNWFVLIPVLAAALLVPLISAAIVAHPPRTNFWRWEAVLTAIGFVGATIGVWYVHSRRPRGESGGQQCGPVAASGGVEAGPREAEPADQRAFLLRCLLPIIVATASLSTAWLWMRRATDGPSLTFIPSWSQDWRLGAVLATLSLLAHLSGWLLTWRTMESRGRWGRLKEGVAVGLTGALMGPLVVVAASLVELLISRVSPHLNLSLRWLPLVLGVSAQPNTGIVSDVVLETMFYFPVFLAGLVLCGFLFVGWTSADRPDDEREWSARYSAWLIITAVTWFAFAAAVLLSGVVLFEVKRLLASVVAAGCAGGTAAALGFGDAPTKKGGDASVKEMAYAVLHRSGLVLASSVAVVLVLVALSGLDTVLVASVARGVGRSHACVVLLGADGTSLTCGAPGAVSPLAVLVATGLALLLLGFISSRKIDVNRFSLHAMYRMRLVRAYLGASRPTGTRRQNPFTQFDPDDNLHMHCLEDLQPLEQRPPIHVLNMALNVGEGAQSADSDRKARSFTATQLHAGSWNVGYRRTHAPPPTKSNESPQDLDLRWRDGTGYYGGTYGMTLGTAMAVSGAAASPNMGYHSSPAVTFLMTLFNARLGWWLGNPGWAGDETFNLSCATTAISPIYGELFGLTSDRTALINLSDGGHFENLGIYEMVLRRAPVIVAVDASCDQGFAYSDLGNAIERVREDFGIEISLDATANIAPSTRIDGLSCIEGSFQRAGTHYALGRIGYAAVHPGMQDGMLVYVKPTLTGDEPMDVLAYKRSSTTFPQESTAEQFFSETQFESYRALGAHSIEGLFASGGPPGAREWLARLEELRANR